MKCILKTEFFIARKTKLWMNITMVGTIFFFLATFIVHNSIDQRMLGAMDLMDPNTAVNTTNLSYLAYCERLIGSDTIVMFTSIFSILFILVEFQHGYIKNIWTSIENKLIFLASKYIVILCFIIFMIMISGLVVAISNPLYLNIEEIGDINLFLKFLVIQVLLQFSFCCCMVCVANFLRQKTFILIVSIVYITFAPQMIYSVFNYLIRKIFDTSKDFLIQKFLPYGNMEIIKANSESSDYIRAIIVALTFILGATLVSIATYNKKDVL